MAIDDRTSVRINSSKIYRTVAVFNSHSAFLHETDINALELNGVNILSLLWLRPCQYHSFVFPCCHDAWVQHDVVLYLTLLDVEGMLGIGGGAG